MKKRISVSVSPPEYESGLMGWNLRERIKYKIGIEVHRSGDSRTTIFSRVDGEEFTEEQESQIEKIMSEGKLAFGPSQELVLPENSIVIHDIHDYKEKVEKKCGFRFQLYYRQTEAFKGTSTQDEIWIVACSDDYQSKRELTQKEIRAFHKAYADLVRIE